MLVEADVLADSDLLIEADPETDVLSDSLSDVLVEIDVLADSEVLVEVDSDIDFDSLDVSESLVDVDADQTSL